MDETVPDEQQVGLVQRILDKKAYRVQFQMDRLEASVELPGVTAVRVFNEDSREVFFVSLCVSWLCVVCDSV